MTTRNAYPWPDVDEMHDTEATSGGEVTDEGVTVRATAAEAQANLFAVLQLCAAAKIRCSDKTRRPGIATLGEVAEALVAGDFYLLQSPPSPGHYWCKRERWPSWPVGGCG